MIKPEIDVDVEVLLAALNDEATAEKLMDERGWTKQDLLEKAEQLNQALVAAMGTISVV